jgi:hypothetical protein
MKITGKQVADFQGFQRWPKGLLMEGFSLAGVFLGWHESHG